MRLVMVYREKSEARLAVETFMKDFKEQTGGEIEVVDPDTRAGWAFCNAYDVTVYPTMLALTPEGTPMRAWRTTLPTISDASAYK
ncbi:MAG: hypothetical protein LBQ11_01135 [Candidatus Nomurabacteria bacterium]|jgi:hypothetical protein|nr:hypothetical protein [Candidatus Nomurabacteria bacterium]